MPCDHALQVGDGVTLADVGIACALLPLFQSVLGTEAQKGYPSTCKWLLSFSQLPHAARVLGAVNLCDAAADWVAPSLKPDHGKKKKKKKSAGGDGAEGGDQQQQQQQQSPKEEDDPEKAAKKVRSIDGGTARPLLRSL
jgi:elongation factor 1-gamma